MLCLAAATGLAWGLCITTGHALVIISGLSLLIVVFLAIFLLVVRGLLLVLLLVLFTKRGILTEVCACVCVCVGRGGGERATHTDTDTDTDTQTHKHTHTFACAREQCAQKRRTDSGGQQRQRMTMKKMIMTAAMMPANTRPARSPDPKRREESMWTAWLLAKQHVSLFVLIFRIWKQALQQTNEDGVGCGVIVEVDLGKGLVEFKELLLEKGRGRRGSLSIVFLPAAKRVSSQGCCVTCALMVEGGEWERVRWRE